MKLLVIAALIIQSTVYGQIDHSSYLKEIKPQNRFDENGRQGYGFGNYSFYFDPIKNRTDHWNAYRSDCFEENDAPENCLMVLDHFIDGSLDGEFNYYNNDTILLMSGYFKDNKLHGVFSFYTHNQFMQFPSYDSLSTYPTRQIIYHKGKKILDVNLNSKGQPIGRMKTRWRQFKWD